RSLDRDGRLLLLRSAEGGARLLVFRAVPRVLARERDLPIRSRLALSTRRPGAVRRVRRPGRRRSVPGLELAGAPGLERHLDPRDGARAAPRVATNAADRGARRAR